MIRVDLEYYVALSKEADRKGIIVKALVSNII